ncbi:MAG: hypothetical protein K8R92_05770 [Planctomycetes bacterium]|nr:hypothetical protein [Planctomycetota bacterium]
MVSRASHPVRRGFALLDAILGGVLLALGLAAVITLSQRSLVMLQRGEHEAQASALLDELLGQVLAEGPVQFARRRPIEGRCEAPWNEWSFSIDITSTGEGDAWDVMATVTDTHGVKHRCATKVAPRDVQTPPTRKPEQPIDRKERFEKKHEAANGG